MNINPLGISAYGKAEVSRKSPDPAQRAQESFSAETKKLDNSAVKSADAQRVAKSEQDNSVTMARRDAETSSSLAVRAQSEFAQLLSPEEREAIETLFARYTEGQPSGVSYGATGQQSHTPRLGDKVDYRV